MIIFSALIVYMFILCQCVVLLRVLYLFDYLQWFFFYFFVLFINQNITKCLAVFSNFFIYVDCRSLNLLIVNIIFSSLWFLSGNGYIHTVISYLCLHPFARWLYYPFCSSVIAFQVLLIFLLCRYHCYCSAFLCLASDLIICSVFHGLATSESGYIQFRQTRYQVICTVSHWLITTSSITKHKELRFVTLMAAIRKSIMQLQTLFNWDWIWCIHNHINSHWNISFSLIRIFLHDLLSIPF